MNLSAPLPAFGHPAPCEGEGEPEPEETTVTPAARVALPLSQRTLGEGGRAEQGREGASRRAALYRLHGM